MAKIRGLLKFTSEERFVAWAREYAKVYARIYAPDDGIAEVEEIIVHERAHFEMARSLGYDPVYQVFGLIDSNGDPNNTIVDAYQVDYRGKRPIGDDLIKILLAPKDPSREDIDNADKARKTLENK